MCHTIAHILFITWKSITSSQDHRYNFVYTNYGDNNSRTCSQCLSDHVERNSDGLSSQYHKHSTYKWVKVGIEGKSVWSNLTKWDICSAIEHLSTSYDNIHYISYATNYICEYNSTPTLKTQQPEANHLIIATIKVISWFEICGI